MGGLTVGRVLARSLLAALLIVGSLVAAPAVTIAAEPTFGTPSIDATFGQGIEITQPVTLDEPVSRVEVLLTTADSLGPLVVELPAPAGTGAVTLRHTLDVGADGHILPNTPVTVRWRLTPEGDGADPVEGPEASTVYTDDRFTWQTISGEIVRVHWYEGGRDFGERALRLGEEAIADTEALLGVTEDEPVDFFIYADQAAFYDALGPGTRENVGGQANAGIRTLFALISPSEIDDAWVEIVVPHELVHLVFDTAVQNPYHFPPRWLNEGLAVFQSQGYVEDDRATVEASARDGTLIPLEGLTGQFPTTASGFFLAYAESVSAVDYLIRTHGEDALVTLIRSYADGRTDDEAFVDALGVDTAAFGKAWLADLGAVVPERRGPRPAPPGPEPAEWGTAPAGPAASATPGSGAATALPGGPAAPGGTTGGGGGPGGGILLVLVAIGFGLAIAGLVLVRRGQGDRRRRARPDAGSAAA